MCLAVPGKVVERRADDAIVDIDGNRLHVSVVLTPEAHEGAWVLVHAGFAITEIEESAALETWDYLHAARDLSFLDEAGFPDMTEKPPPRPSPPRRVASARVADAAGKGGIA